jgi:protein-disulfide isomerase
LFSEKPTYREANQKAAELIGTQELQQALQSPIPGNYIAKHVALYQKAGAGTIPKLMFPETTVVGAIESEASMTRLIEQNLATPRLRN